MPSPRERTDTRAATPMMMPSVDRSVRSGLARSVSKPTRSEEAAMRSSISLGEGSGAFGRTCPYGRRQSGFRQGPIVKPPPRPALTRLVPVGWRGPTGPAPRGQEVDEPRSIVVVVEVRVQDRNEVRETRRESFCRQRVWHVPHEGSVCSAKVLDVRDELDGLP